MANVKFTKEIDEQIVLIAKKYGLKPNDLRAIVQIESKGDPYASASTSSAEGLMQVLDSTGKQYGLIGDDKFDIIKNLDAGARLMRDNKNAFIKKFKREPTAGELYFAHQQGFTGSSRILSADKDANILTVPGMTDKKVLDNGGKTSMTAGEFADKWVNKANKLANNMSVEYINVPLRTSNSQQARFLNTEEPKLRPDNLEVPVEPTVNTLVPQQTSIPQMRPDNLSIQEQEVPQPQSFGQAFSQARQQHGGDGGVFEWNGNKYTTDIAKEVPAVAEPMFPREEFVPTVPPRVTSTADNRINVPPFKGLEIPELGFNDGTNSVPMNFSGVRNTGTGEGITAMDAARFVAEATPIVGDAMSAKEIYDELQKPKPNYALITALGGASLVGLIPGLGDAVAPMLKKGARNLFDTVKRIEIDPNTLGMSGGNVSLKSKGEVPVSNFTTAKGSTYDQYDNATTMRNRASRQGDALKGEVSGIQPRSNKTVYMSKEAIDEFGPMFQNTEIPSSFVPLPDNKAKLVLRENFGPRPAGSDLTKELDFSLSPKKGLHPVEIMRSDNSNKRNIHFGNEIIEINNPIKKFNNGTNSVPGYNRGTVMIDPNDPDKLLAREALYNVNRFQDSLAPPMPVQPERPFLDYDIAQDDLAFAQPIPQANSNDSTFTKPVDGSMRFALNTATSLDNRYPIPLTQRQIDTRANRYARSTADGSYGDPQAGYSQQPVPMVVNATPPGYDSGPVGTSVNAVPPGYDAGPVGTSVNAVPPGYNAGPVGTTINAVPPGYKAVPQREPIDDMVPGENTFVYNNGYQIKSDRFGVPEAVSPFRIDPEKMKKITKRYADNEITAEQYQLQKKEFDNAVYQDQAHKDYLSKLKEQKDIVSNEENLNSISILDQRIAEAKEAGDNVLVAELEANKNKLLKSTTVPKVKEEPIVTKEDNTLSSTSKTEKSKMRVATLNNEKIDLDDDENKKLFNFTSNDVKEKVGSLLQTFFGLETADLGRAIGFYLASRATGASHAGSMRWAGTTVLKQAENNKVLNSKKSDVAITAFAKISSKYKPSAVSKINKLLTEGKLVEAQTEMSKSSNMTARGQMGISRDDAGTQMIRRGYTTPTTVFTGTNGIYYEKITGKKDGKTFETYKPLTTADSNQLRPLGASDTNFNYLNNARKILDEMPAGYFRQAGKDPSDPQGEEKPAGLFGVGDKTGVMADIERLSRELAGKGVPNMPEALALKLSGLAQLAEAQGIKAISASQLLEIAFSGSDSLIDSKLITKDGDEETIIPSAEIVDFTKKFREQFNNDYNTSNKNMSTIVTEYRQVKPSSVKVIEQLDEFKSLTDKQKEEVKSAPNLFMSYALTKAYSNNK